MMRWNGLIGAAAMAVTAISAAPLAAQDDNRSGARDVLGRVLDVILGPDEQAEEETEVAEAVQPVVPSLDEVLAHERRDGDRARDAFRNPAATLGFFQVEPTHSVVEYAPGGGWYTRILAPYVAPAGQYTAITFAPEAASSLGENFVARVRSAVGGFSDNQSEALGIPADKLPIYTGPEVPEEMNGTVDRVLMIRMLHNLKRWGVADTELMTLRRILKDDGLVGIVQHQAPESMGYALTDGNRGYLKKSDVVALMDAYGFELVSESFVNVNAKDDATHPAGVWTLPPTYARGEQDREKYTAIGETSRMTLLFRKAR